MIEREAGRVSGVEVLDRPEPGSGGIGSLVPLHEKHGQLTPPDGQRPGVDRDPDRRMHGGRVVRREDRRLIPVVF